MTQNHPSYQSGRIGKPRKLIPDFVFKFRSLGFGAGKDCRQFIFDRGVRRNQSRYRSYIHGMSQWVIMTQVTTQSRWNLKIGDPTYVVFPNKSMVDCIYRRIKDITRCHNIDLVGNENIVRNCTVAAITVITHYDIVGFIRCDFLDYPVFISHHLKQTNHPSSDIENKVGGRIRYPIAWELVKP